MSILKLMKLFDDQKIAGLSAHDVFNWVAGSVELVLHPRRINGMFVVYVSTGTPYKIIIPRTDPFFEACKAMVVVEAPTGRLYDSDIKDRFKSHGKLWLVLANGKVLPEESVRVYGNVCRNCRAVPVGARDVRLFQRQDRLCTTCFAQLLPEDKRFDYLRSTWKSYRTSHGYSVNYDPVLGVVESTLTQADSVNRAVYLDSVLNQHH